MSYTVNDPACEAILDVNEQPFEYEKLSRRCIRSLIFHYLYAVESFDYDVSVESVVDLFNRGFELDVPIKSEVVETTRSVVEQRDMLDERVKPFLANWRLERIGVCTRLVMRLALWELLNTDTPSTIVINEAIELAKCFSEDDAYRFVNGILDEFTKSLNRA